MVVFAHGSGSGRHSLRNQYVARDPSRKAALGTLLLDLLEDSGVDDCSKVFDIGLLAGRLQAMRRLAGGLQPETKGLRLGYFAMPAQGPGAGMDGGGPGTGPPSGAIVCAAAGPTPAVDALTRA